jgi:hypothetical protein
LTNQLTYIATQYEALMASARIRFRAKRMAPRRKMEWTPDKSAFPGLIGGLFYRNAP